MYLADKSLEDAGNYNLEIISVSKVTLSTSWKVEQETAYVVKGHSIVG